MGSEMCIRDRVVSKCSANFSDNCRSRRSIYLLTNGYNQALPKRLFRFFFCSVTALILRTIAATSPVVLSVGSALKLPPLDAKVKRIYFGMLGPTWLFVPFRLSQALFGPICVSELLFGPVSVSELFVWSSLR